MTILANLKLSNTYRSIVFLSYQHVLYSSMLLKNTYVSKLTLSHIPIHLVRYIYPFISRVSLSHSTIHVLPIVKTMFYRSSIMLSSTRLRRLPITYPAIRYFYSNIDIAKEQNLLASRQ